MVVTYQVVSSVNVVILWNNENIMGVLVGTSLAKVVYRSKKDYKDGKPIFTKVFHLTLKRLTTHQHDKFLPICVTYAQEHAYGTLFNPINHVSLSVKPLLDYLQNNF